MTDRSRTVTTSPPRRIRRQGRAKAEALGRVKASVSGLAKAAAMDLDEVETPAAETATLAAAVRAAEAAVAAARSIKFIPAQKDGRAVSQYVTIEYNFNIY